jgi:hypothetical protein
VSQELDDLARQWCDAKTDEAIAVAKRRTLEDRISELLELDAAKEGTSTARTEQGWVIKTTSRLNRKVDADRLQELATEHGLTEHLSKLFRWSAEISMTAWKSAADNITRPLLGAIETKPGRPTFSISKKED